MKKINILRDLKMILCAIVSAAIEGMAQTTFVIPGKFYPSGIAGLCKLISAISIDYFNFELSYPVIYLIFNLILAAIVFKEIGKRFTIYSFIQTALVSLFIEYLPPLLSVDDMLLLSIFGGIVNGIGVGIALANDLSSGGTDFLNVYFSNKFNRSIINEILYLNIIIIVTSGILYGWKIAMYSIIYSYVSTQVVKTFHKRYTHVTINIITTKPQEVIDNIHSKVRHGITIMNCEGAYLHQKETMLYMVVNTFQTNLVIKAVEEIDINAFINVQRSEKVVGNYYQLPLD